MSLLLIDTASAEGIALAYRASPDSPIATRVARGAQDHSRQLLPEVDALLDGQRRALSAIGVVTGPGSYAGLRVGIATAEALALALRVPVYGVSTFEATRTAAGEGVGAVVQPAGRNEYAVQRYVRGTPSGKPFLAGPDELTAIGPIAGEGAGALGGREIGREERARAALALVEARIARGVRPGGIEAFYIREPNVTRPKRTPLVATARAAKE